MFMNNKKVLSSELIFGVTMSVGMVMFAIADFQVYPDANFTGI